MKFVAFWEFCPENREKVLAKGEEYIKERKQNPERFSRYLRLQDGTGIGFAIIGHYKGITLLEADDEGQMQNTVSFFAPLMKFTYLPILQTAAAQQG
jgi:hypothetical protein